MEKQERTRSPRSDQLPVCKGDKIEKGESSLVGVPAPGCPTGLPPDATTPEWMLNPTWSSSTYTSVADMGSAKDKDKDNHKKDPSTVDYRLSSTVSGRDKDTVAKDKGSAKKDKEKD